MASWLRYRGIVSLGVLYLIPVVLWADARPFDVWFRDRAPAVASLTGALGLVAVSAFAVNLILGARLYPLQRWFGGVENLYRVHRGNGRLAYLLALAHVAIEVARRLSSGPLFVLDLFTPSAGRAILFGVVAFVSMTAAIVATLYVRMTHEVFIYVQRSFGIIFAIAVVHVFLTPGAKASSDLLTFYLLALTASALAAYAYRSVFGNVLVRRFDYVVTEAR